MTNEQRWQRRTVGVIPRVMLWLSLLGVALPASADELTFGIVPQESLSRLAEQWTPLLQYLSGVTGTDIRFASAPDIPTFEQRLLKGEYDIAYMNPYHYVEFSQSPGYRAIAREGGKLITGIVVVPENSPVTDLAELANDVIAFPAPAAFAATILVRAELEQREIPYTPRFVSSHQSVYLNVANGFAGAGGGIERTYGAAVSDGLTGLRVLWRSNGYTPHAFAVHPRVDPQLAARVQHELATLASHEVGRAWLGTMNMTPLISAEDSDWLDVRSLGLDFIRRPETADQ